MLKESPEKKKTYHYSFAWDRGTLIGVGTNEPNQENPKAIYFARRFNNPAQLEYPFLHSEVSLISSLWGKVLLNSRIKVVNIRLNRRFEIHNSIPCPSCAKILQTLNCKVWASTNFQTIVRCF